MAIVNAGALPVYSDIPADLLKLCEDAILNRTPTATEALLKRAELERAEGFWRQEGVIEGPLMAGS